MENARYPCLETQQGLAWDYSVVALRQGFPWKMKADSGPGTK